MNPVEMEDSTRRLDLMMAGHPTKANHVVAVQRPCPPLEVEAERFPVAEQRPVAAAESCPSCGGRGYNLYHDQSGFEALICLKCQGSGGGNVQRQATAK